MYEKTAIFRPERAAVFKKSSLAAVSLFTRIFALCSQYLAQASFGKVDIPITDAYLTKFWRLNFSATNTSLFVKGLHHLNPGETYMYMSNHESWMDIPAIFGAVPGSLRMVSKAGIMKIPVIGKAMEAAGFIAVDRKNRSLAIKQLSKAKERLNSGISIWMAPEGTRSRSGELASFKKGGFHLAYELGVKIVPVYIEGARKVMPADTLLVNTNRAITVHFCEPVSTELSETRKLIDLIAEVREAILRKKNDNEDGGAL